LGAREHRAVELDRHLEAAAHGFDAVGQVRQVHALQLDAGAGVRRVDGLHVDVLACQRVGGVEVDALPTRADRAAHGGVQALGEADAERVFFVAGRVVPAGLVEGEQLLEVLDPGPVVLHAQRPGLRIVVNLDQRSAGTPRVLQQFGDQRESVGEGKALVAQRAFLVDADAYLHDELSGSVECPRTAGKTIGHAFSA
jgi:hypothetical protein